MGTRAGLALVPGDDAWKICLVPRKVERKSPEPPERHRRGLTCGESGSRISRPQTGWSLILATLQTADVRASPGSPVPHTTTSPSRAGDFSFGTKPPGAQQRERDRFSGGSQSGEACGFFAQKSPSRHWVNR